MNQVTSGFTKCARLSELFFKRKRVVIFKKKMFQRICTRKLTVSELRKREKNCNLTRFKCNKEDSSLVMKLIGLLQLREGERTFSVHLEWKNKKGGRGASYKG